MVRVLRQCRLSVKTKTQHRRHAGYAGGNDHAPGDGAGYKTQTSGILLHIARTPGGMAGPQHKAQLGVVVAGKLIEFTRPGHLFTHLGKVRRAVDGIAKGLCLHHKLGVFNFIERARTVGQLHPGLKHRIALARQRHLPALRQFVESFNGKGLAASPASGRHGGQCRITRDQPL